LIKKDYSVYSRRILELFFKDLLATTGKFNKIGSYWEKNNTNEIDIIAVNENKKKLMIVEVKLKSSNINLNVLKDRASKLLLSYPDYQIKWKGLSLETVRDFVGF
ncbi:MAG: ATPase, partial [Candidatus Cloacimonetes bacterium]|nr:ATPase [Candidatus Cloacimonadota bacterium]